MKKMLLMLVLSCGLMFGCSACEEEDLQKIDAAAEQVPAITETGEAIIQSVPPILQPHIPMWGIITGVAALAGDVALALAAVWLKFRKSQAETALKEVVVGGELFKKSNNETTESFKESQAIAQSVATTEKVAAIRRTVAA